ncbi:transglycosylase [Bacillus pumilus]|nr:transglycosylase [Bacillus pumilus]
MGMDNQKCVCDQCGTTFNIASCSRIRKIGEGIKQHLLVCPRCKTEYTSYYTNAYIRQQQSKIRKLFVVLRNTKAEKAIEMHKMKIATLQENLQIDMKQLRIEMEAPPGLNP